MKKGEIRFSGSELHTCILKLDITTPDGLEKVTRHLQQARIALEVCPKSSFWKDAIKIMEIKLGA